MRSHSRLLAGILVATLLGIFLFFGESARSQNSDEILRILVPDEGVDILLTLGEIEALGTEELVTDTPWNDGPQTFSGVPLVRLVDHFAPNAETLLLTALNDYSVTLPVIDTRDFPVLLATRLAGRPMAVRERGPLWVVYPLDQFEELRRAEYEARMIWQLTEIILR